MVYKALDALGRGLFPPHCILCLTRDKVSVDYLCDGCKADLPWLQHCCDVCSLPLPNTGGGMRCGRCLQQPPAFDRCIGAFYYADPIAQLISDFKYRAKLNYGRVLGLQLAVHLANKYSSQSLPGVILPVPLHRSRLRSRGFNQSLELAKTVGRQLRIPVANRYLLRCRATASQKDLHFKQRQHNVHAAFAVRTKHRLPTAPRSTVAATVPDKVPNTAPDTVALLDDVVTSGATVAELAQLLKDNGVAQVHVWCVARTERG